MQIDIISDTVCPWCYIGKRRLEQAMAMSGDEDFAVAWHPFQLNPEVPAGGVDYREHMEAKFGDRIEAMIRRVTDAGRSAGIEFAFDSITRTPNTIDSHRLIRWAGGAGVQSEVVEALFQRYFVEGDDIGARDVLVDVAWKAGMDPEIVTDLLDKGADVERVREEDAFAREMGVTGVPCFIFDQRYVIAGAQDPAVFVQLFERMAVEPEDAAEVDEAAGTDDESEGPPPAGA